MKKLSIVLSSLLLGSLSYANNIETLDTISVESSTSFTICFTHYDSSKNRSKIYNNFVLKITSIYLHS